MSIKCLLFDFDGTIADTNNIIFLSLQEAVEKYTGFRPSKKDLMPVFGRLLIDQMSYFNKENAPDMAQCYKETYHKLQFKMVKPFPGVIRCINMLKNNGIILGIVSAKTRNGIMTGLNTFGIDKCFDIIISAQDITKSKPDPEPVIKAVKKASVDFNEAIMIGDSPYDIESGNNAGTKTALVNWTLFSDDYFKDLKIDYRLNNMDELTSII